MIKLFKWALFSIVNLWYRIVLTYRYLRDNVKSYEMLEKIPNKARNKAYHKVYKIK